MDKSRASFSEALSGSKRVREASVEAGQVPDPDMEYEAVLREKLEASGPRGIRWRAIGRRGRRGWRGCSARSRPVRSRWHRPRPWILGRLRCRALRWPRSPLISRLLVAQTARRWRGEGGVWVLLDLGPRVVAAVLVLVGAEATTAAPSPPSSVRLRPWIRGPPRRRLVMASPPPRCPRAALPLAWGPGLWWWNQLWLYNADLLCMPS